MLDVWHGLKQSVINDTKNEWHKRRGREFYKVV